MKVCFKCSAEKPLGEFSKDCSSKDGHQKQCKQCNRDYRVAHAARIALTQSIWRESTKDSRRAENIARGRKYRSENSDKLRDYYQRNKEKILAQCKAYRSANKEQAAEHKRRWVKSNPERRRASANKWAAANPEKRKEQCAKRRAVRRRAMPAWANLVAVRQVYLSCPAGFEVDHIYPLVSDWVSGLHNEFNLQHLRTAENAAKSNRRFAAHHFERRVDHQKYPCVTGIITIHE